ncbi:MAG: hypothetical protein WCX27_01180 [Candidatus Paceibacterota bacterium]|jgi:hypothetical protein
MAIRNETVLVPFSHIKRGFFVKLFLKDQSLIPIGTRYESFGQEAAKPKKRVGKNLIPKGLRFFYADFNRLWGSGFDPVDIWCDVKQNRTKKEYVLTIRFGADASNVERFAYAMKIASQSDFIRLTASSIWRDAKCWVNPDESICVTLSNQEKADRNQTIGLNPFGLTMTNWERQHLPVAV